MKHVPSWILTAVKIFEKWLLKHTINLFHQQPLQLQTLWRQKNNFMVILKHLFLQTLLRLAPFFQFFSCQPAASLQTSSKIVDKKGVVV